MPDRFESSEGIRDAAIIVDDAEWLSTLTYRPTTIVLPFKFLDFEAGINERFSPKFDQIRTIGRHSPHFVYLGGTRREISFSALVIDETLPGYAMSSVSALQALTLPWQTPSEDNARKPPQVLLSIFPKSFMLIRGVLADVGRTAMSPLVVNEGIGVQHAPLIAGQVAVDITFITTESAENRDVFRYVRSGHAQYSGKQYDGEAGAYTFG